VLYGTGWKQMTGTGAGRPAQRRFASTHVGLQASETAKTGATPWRTSSSPRV